MYRIPWSASTVQETFRLNISTRVIKNNSAIGLLDCARALVASQKKNFIILYRHAIGRKTNICAAGEPFNEDLRR